MSFFNEDHFTQVASGLEFPEGPVVLADGSIVVVEIKSGAITRIDPSDGKKSVIATPGGGPNGAALGPDGALYVCNNGGFEWGELMGMTVPGDVAADYTTGRIERVDLDTGEVEVLYADVAGVPLKGPNDLVFDSAGGFWFTDHGKIRERTRDRGGLYYAKPDGSEVREVAFPLDAPNGVGLSPGGDKLYVAETFQCRLMCWELEAPGQVAESAHPLENYLASPGGSRYFDSLAVDAEGNISVGTIIAGGVTSFSPSGEELEFAAVDDLLCTNICFGGADMTTAYLTLSGTGRLVAGKWPRAGLPLEW